MLPTEEAPANSVPAAAVIPAPIGYIKVVAVKKLVVEFLEGRSVFLEKQFFMKDAAFHFVDFCFV